MAVAGIGGGGYFAKHPRLAPMGLNFTPEELAQARALLVRHPSIDAHAHPGRTFVAGAEHVSGLLWAAKLLGTFEGRTIGEMTVEGGDFLEGQAARVKESYADGVRSITLMHYRNNELGDIITGAPVQGGLSAAGVAVVKVMNAIGMLIDVAHASETTAFGILKASAKPVMASHVHVHTEKLAHPRFISRDLAKAVAANGGQWRPMAVGCWVRGPQASV